MRWLLIFILLFLYACGSTSKGGTAVEAVPDPDDAPPSIQIPNIPEDENISGTDEIDEQSGLDEEEGTNPENIQTFDGGDFAYDGSQFSIELDEETILLPKGEDYSNLMYLWDDGLNYVAKYTPNATVLAGQYADVTFIKVGGEAFVPPMDNNLNLTGAITILKDGSFVSSTVNLTAYLSHFVPRLNGSNPDGTIDVFALFEPDGTLSSGHVSYVQDRADLEGGMFGTSIDDMTLVGGFSGPAFSGILEAQ